MNADTVASYKGSCAGSEACIIFCKCLLLLTIVICQQRELLLPNNGAFLIRGTNADKTFLNISERSLGRNLIAGIFSP